MPAITAAEFSTTAELSPSTTPSLLTIPSQPVPAKLLESSPTTPASSAQASPYLGSAPCKITAVLARLTPYSALPPSAQEALSMPVLPVPSPQTSGVLNSVSPMPARSTALLTSVLTNTAPLSRIRNLTTATAMALKTGLVPQPQLQRKTLLFM